MVDLRERGGEQGKKEKGDIEGQTFTYKKSKSWG